MQIVIVRHAEPDYQNNTLTEKGFREAEYLAKYLKNKKIDYIYSSPLNRAKFTAEAVSRARNNQKIEILDFLQEFEGRVEYKQEKEHRAWDFDINFLTNTEDYYDSEKWIQTPPFNNENLKYEYGRVRNGIINLLKKHGYEKQGRYYKVNGRNTDTVYLFCHFGVESFILSVILNVSPILLGNFTVARPSSMTVLNTEEREDGKAIFRMCEFGGIEHLAINNEETSKMAMFAETFGDGSLNVR